jgi:hypothetical protein
MITGSAMVCLVATSHGALARSTSVLAPVLSPGDSWTYANSIEARGNTRTTHDMITVKQADNRFIAITVKAVGASGPGSDRLVGPNWSVVRSVNGRQTVVNQPLAFPLSVNKSWTMSYTEQTPADRTHLREQISMTYKVTGWEDVTVAAGTFHAARIEGDGSWTADLPGNTLTARARTANGSNVAVMSQQASRVASGRMLATFWYVPEVERWVKCDEEIYSSTGVLTKRTTAELESFEVAPQSEKNAQDDAPEPPKRRHAKSKPAVAAEPSAPPPTTPRKPPPPSAPAPALLQEL